MLHQYNSKYECICECSYTYVWVTELCMCLYNKVIETFNNWIVFFWKSGKNISKQINAISKGIYGHTWQKKTEQKTKMFLCNTSFYYIS